MILTETRLRGVHIVDLQRIEDKRGFFARAWCQEEFRGHQLNPCLVQSNVGFSTRRGTLRGMHYQLAPHEEAKLVRCTMGAIWDVMIDLRPESPTHMQWVAVELTAQNRRMLYAPAGFAHGYLTLTDNAEVFYHTSEFYVPAAVRGVRYNDPAFGITWPSEIEVISDTDQSWPDYCSRPRAASSRPPRRQSHER